jgi:hypothetical protein
MDPNAPKPPPPVDPGPNPDYARMLALVEGPDSGWPPAETRLLLALLKLHEPRWVGYGTRYECRGCEFQGYEAESPDWPCETVTVVAGHLGAEL